MQAFPLPRQAQADTCAVPLAEEAIELIVDFEVGGQALYVRRYQHPIWPGAASGVTIGGGKGVPRREVIYRTWG